MPIKTEIEWADYISNPIRAFVSPGGKDGHACVKISEGCVHCWASRFNVWKGTGLEYTYQNMNKVTNYVKLKELDALRKLSPKGPFKNGRNRAIVFPCDIIDLFGGWVDHDYIHAVMNAMAYNTAVDFMVLTKRPELAQLALEHWLKIYVHVPGNIFIGASVENNTRALERIDSMRFISSLGIKTAVSYEPALDLVDWSGWHFLNWVICGGETGPKARPMRVESARGAREFCQHWGIPFFFKHWGEYAHVSDLVARGVKTFKNRPVNGMVKVGKGLAGHLLDGVEWRQMP